MRVLRRTSFVLAAALLCAGIAAAAPPQSSRFAALTNYTQAKRSESAIRFIIIHVSEGSFPGTVAWLRDPKAHASANFVVGRKGQVQQLVPLHDIAWHAGNWAYNLRSVGIENEGFTDDPLGFTNAEYRSTARLAAVIARRALIPIDRRHIIGHYQVPDPNDPLQGGGIDNHTDPGKYWRWSYFLKLVERFAYPQKFFKERHVGLQIASSTLYNGQVVAGGVPWRRRSAARCSACRSSSTARNADRPHRPVRIRRGPRARHLRPEERQARPRAARVRGQVVDAEALRRAREERAFHPRDGRHQGETESFRPPPGAGALHGGRTGACAALSRWQADRSRHLAAVSLQVGYASGEGRPTPAHARGARTGRSHRQGRRSACA